MSANSTGLKWFAFSSAFLLCSCSSDSDVTVEPEPPITSPPSVNQARAFDGPLENAGAADFSQFLRNGIYAATINGGVTRDADGGAPESLSPALQSGFSTTNTQEQGVDEADRIEYDGETLFVAAYPQWLDGENTAPRIRVLKRNDDFSLTETDSLALFSENANVDGLYLGEGRLAAIGADFPVYPLIDIAIEPWGDPAGKVDISIFDTSDKDNIVPVAEMKIDGWLLSSRRIDNQLYVVSTFVPSVADLSPGAETQEVRLENYLKILDTPLTEIMPQLHIGENSRPLNAPQDCLIPADAEDADGFAQILTITKIDMQQPDNVESVCMSLYAFMLYMSEQNIYLASSLEQNTGFHKISLTDMSYQAFGTVTGQIGWRGLPNLRIDEEDGYLRVLSTDYSERDPVHKLTVLNQQGGQLQTLAELPNESNPDPIGKPGEDVFAVRFIGDKAYVVTFEQIDPLYVLDLSVADTPVIAGSLEIPGFSSYLHPMDNGFLLGVGQEVSIQDIPETGTIPVNPPVTTGMKVSLFDVSDPANPIELNSVVKESGYTPVEFDYKALSVLNTSGKYQFAMPVEQWGTVGDEPALSLWAPDNSLLLLEVDTNAADVALSEVDQMRATNDSNVYVYGGNDRSVIHGEHVFYIHGNQVWHGLWQAENELDGPY